MLSDDKEQHYHRSTTYQPVHTRRAEVLIRPQPHHDAKVADIMTANSLCKTNSPSKILEALNRFTSMKAMKKAFNALLQLKS